MRESGVRGSPVDCADERCTYRKRSELIRLMTSGCRISGLTSSAVPAADAAPMCGRIGKRCRVRFCKPLRVCRRRWSSCITFTLPSPSPASSPLSLLLSLPWSGCSDDCSRDPAALNRQPIPLVKSVSWMCAPPLVPGRSRQRGTSIPLRSKLESLRTASAPLRLLTDESILDRVNAAKRCRICRRSRCTSERQRGR